jgi:hypothetical protein
MNDTESQVCPRIYTRCPACHNDTLTINKGQLLCTWHKCKDPTLIDRLGEPERAGDRKPATSETEGTKHVGISDLLEVSTQSELLQRT